MGGDIVDSIRRWGNRKWHRMAKAQNNNDRGEDKSSSSVSSVVSSTEDDQVVEYIEGPLDPSTIRPVRVLPDKTRGRMAAPDPYRKNIIETEFFSEYGEANRYQIQEVIGKGSYGVVCSAFDTHTGQRVAIKKINNVFGHVSDATRILREIKLLRLLKHPEIVEIKHIMLPPSPREFKDIYVVFELMESDLHQVIKANNDLTPEQHKFFLYQLLQAMKNIHTANVFHRDLKPKNILANSDCRLKICDFGLARPSFNDSPSAIFWTDYVATRWYRAPELCGSFFSKYTSAIDIWSIGCIFGEILMGKPLFPGRNVAHQLDLMTDMLGTLSLHTIVRIKNDKARRYLSSMQKKEPIPFSQKFPNSEPLALDLLKQLLALEQKDRPTAEEALTHPYFRGLVNADNEIPTRPISKTEFEFERKRLTKDDLRELIYREILEYHPQMLAEYLSGVDLANFMYPRVEEIKWYDLQSIEENCCIAYRSNHPSRSSLGLFVSRLFGRNFLFYVSNAAHQFKRQFSHLEEHYENGEKRPPLDRHHTSLPRERIREFGEASTKQHKDSGQDQ